MKALGRIVVVLAVVAGGVYFIRQSWGAVAPSASEADDASPSTEPSSITAVATDSQTPQEPVRARAQDDEERPASALGVHALDLLVDQYELAMGLPVRLELVFGDGQDLQGLDLIADSKGRARWPGSVRSPRPWFVDFAFPTAGLHGSRLSSDASSVRLRMPRLSVLDVQILEIDGGPTSEAVDVEFRSPTASWPANRWRTLRVINGQAELLAEAVGLAVELRLATASGRVASFSALTSEEGGSRVPCKVHLAPDSGVALSLTGLPLSHADYPWKLHAYGPQGETVTGHRWLGKEHRYVFFPPTEQRSSFGSLLVIAKRSGPKGAAYWGRCKGGNTLQVQRCTVVATGRVIDAAGRNVEGGQVDLHVAGHATVLGTAVTDAEGRFTLLGPKDDGMQLSVCLREARQNVVAAIRIPHEGEILLQSRR